MHESRATSPASLWLSGASLPTPARDWLGRSLSLSIPEYKEHLLVTHNASAGGKNLQTRRPILSALTCRNQVPLLVFTIQLSFKIDWMGACTVTEWVKQSPALLLSSTTTLAAPLPIWFPANAPRETEKDGGRGWETRWRPWFLALVWLLRPPAVRERIGRSHLTF